MADTINIHIYKAFHDFIRSFLPSENIRLLDGNFVAPEGRYTALKVQRLERLSPYTHYIEDALISDTDQRRTIATLYTGHVLIRCFGDNAFARAALINHALSDPSCRKYLSNKNIGYAKTSVITDDSIMLQNQTIEERATQNVEINISLYDLELSSDGYFIDEVITTPNISLE